MKKFILGFIIGGIFVNICNLNTETDDSKKQNDFSSVANTESVLSNTDNALHTYNSTNEVSHSKSYSQCMATTKKGTRCKRAGKYNGYCYQHR